jgi:hypothetical protein
MKIYAVITVARQINGDIVFIKTEKGFQQAGKADELVKKLNNDFKAGDKFKPMKFSSEYGEVECFCTAGGFEIEVEE